MATFDDLPLELAEHIWSFLARDPAGKRHLCAATVPVVRRHAVGSTRLESQTDLVDFRSLVLRADPLSLRLAGVKPVAAYVRNLELPQVVTIRSHHDMNELMEAVVLILIIRIVYLEVKTLDRIGIAALIVLLHLWLPQIPFLPELEELVVRDFDAEAGTARPVSMAHLRDFPSLRSLSLCLKQHDRNAFDALERSTASADVLSSISSLFLLAGRSLGTQSAALFVADFAGLRRLEIVLWARVDLGRFLQACPVTLTSLKIHPSAVLEDASPEPLRVEADLARFVNLTDLALGPYTYSPACELLPILSANLPRLRTLTLESATPLDASRLLPYVVAGGGPSRQLDKLVLDSIYYIMDPIPSQEPDEPDVASGMLDLDKFWIPPGWAPSFTLADARALMVAAERAGVKLEGETARAAEYDAVRAREEKYLLGRRDEVLEAVRGLFDEGDDDGEV